MGEYNEVGELQSFKDEIREHQSRRKLDETLKRIIIEDLNNRQREIWQSYKEVLRQISVGMEKDHELLKNIYEALTKIKDDIDKNISFGDSKFYAWVRNRITVPTMNIYELLDGEKDESLVSAMVNEMISEKNEFGV